MLPDDPLATSSTSTSTDARFQVEDAARPLRRDAWAARAWRIRLLEEDCPPGADPLGPDNPIVLAVGPLIGLFPLASKTVAMFKSPHTGNLGESHCRRAQRRGHPHGRLRRHRHPRGQRPCPSTWSIDGDEVHFRDASALWGMGSSFTAGR